MLLASSVPTQGWPVFGIVVALLFVFAIAGVIAGRRDDAKRNRDKS